MSLITFNVSFYGDRLDFEQLHDSLIDAAYKINYAEGSAMEMYETPDVAIDLHNGRCQAACAPADAEQHTGVRDVAVV